MRAAPTVVPKNVAAISVNSATANVAGSGLVTMSRGPSAMGLDLSCTGLTAGQGCIVLISPGAFLLDARL
jgi:hypothetical protein